MLFPSFKSLALEEILLITLIVFTLFKITLNFLRLGKLAFYKKKQQQTFTPPVSVIICARNEGENLTRFLPNILTQDYDQFEVIVVNDCSYDNTDDVLREFSKVFPNLKAITVKEDEYYKHGKKFALMVGIKGAKHDYLVLTDADCEPASNQWLRKMASGFSNGKEIVLGYGAYFKEKGFLNKLIRYDTFLIGLNYLSASLIRKPYMGVGRNLAYKKDLFFKSKNFSKHYHLISGDDDLFINQVATKENTSIVIDHDAITYSIPKKNWKDWKMQKARHLTTASHYKPGTRSNLGFNLVMPVIMNIMIGICFFFEPLRLTASIALLLNCLTNFILYTNAAKRLNEKNLVSLFFIMDVFLFILYPVFHLKKKIFDSGKWMN